MTNAELLASPWPRLPLLGLSDLVIESAGELATQSRMLAKRLNHMAEAWERIANGPAGFAVWMEQEAPKWAKPLSR